MYVNVYEIISLFVLKIGHGRRIIKKDHSTGS